MSRFELHDRIAIGSAASDRITGDLIPIAAVGGPRP